MQAQHFGIGKKRQVVLVVDQAGWQKARTSRNSRRYTFGVFAVSLSRITTSSSVCGHLRMSRLPIGALKREDEVEEVLALRCRQILNQPDECTWFNQFFLVV